METSIETSISLTTSQKRALQSMQYFVERYDKCFVLSGYAGTGKTTLMRFFIKYLQEQQIDFCLLSSTGRAAKILSNAVGHEAHTVHHLIFTFNGLNQDLSDVDTKEASPDNVGQLALQFDATKYDGPSDKRMVYIIDEASMISDTISVTSTQANFGTGRLLHDLFAYDTRDDSKFVFVGDPCQLPPIQGTISPALSTEYLKKEFGYGTSSQMLTEIVRQAGDSSIVRAAAMIRSLWQNAPETEAVYGERAKVWGRIQLNHYADIEIMPTVDDMRSQYISLIRQNGYNEATFICQSNNDSWKMSQFVRQNLGFTGVVQPGDLLMVMQNQITTGLMNGDMVEVVSVGNKPEYVDKTDNRGYHTHLEFIDVVVRELFTGRTINTLLLLSILEGGAGTNLNSRQQTGLFLDFVLRMREKGITQKNKERFNEALFRDPYLNALRCSYGYAITCHKAQGGEWNHVFIQPQRNVLLNPTKHSYQWLYTAITRAKKCAYFPNEFYIC
jgi:GTPase SAR1 family protein